jgi:NifU-like protein involved in Fe-S cluster formation
VTVRAATKLYSPELLDLATGLAKFPLSDDLPLRADARSRSCGSVITLGLALDEAGQIARIGMQVSACAIGQASAALLAHSAAACAPATIDAVSEALELWLGGHGALPDWPGIAALAPVRDHPGRHGALLLPWTAARMALSQAQGSR